jgi:hypothetical protein
MHPVPSGRGLGRKESFDARYVDEEPRIEIGRLLSTVGQETPPSR